MHQSIMAKAAVTIGLVVLMAGCRDAVTGNGVLTYQIDGSIQPAAAVNLDVHSDADGSNPSGSLTGQTKYVQPINEAATCLRVVGNRAVIGFHTFFWLVTDNTPSGTPDTVTTFGSGTSAADGCPPPTDMAPTLTFSSGGVDIVDAAVTTSP